MHSQRWMAAAVLAVALAASLALGSGIGRVPMILFAGLALITVLTLPRQDVEARSLIELLVLTAGTLTVYAATQPWLMLTGYVLATLPFLDRRRPYSSLLLAASCVALGTELGTGSFWFLLTAVVLRKVTAPFESSRLGTAGLLFNGHLGAFLMVRLTPASHAEQWLPVVGAAVLIASLLPALVALVETRPRRILALVAASQAGCILAGLVSSTSEGVQGALMQWIVVGLASTGMLTVYRLVEVRYGAEITGRDFLGLAERFPRLAVFFFVCALAMVGLPGTLGFLAEDLIIHGVMETHPYVGILQPLAAALNAITLLRLSSTLFLGRRVKGLEAIPDALPHERWPLAALVVLLVLGGLAPSYVASMDTPATNAVTARR
jgi:hypothetical protein